MKFVFLIQARLGSTRLPRKTLTEITNGKTLLESVYERVMKAQEASSETVYIMTSDSKEDDLLVSFMKERGIRYDRGSEQDVYGRFYNFLQSLDFKPDYIIRICCDNPFIEPEFIDEKINFLKNNSVLFEYVTHQDSQGNPSMATHYGFFSEAILYDAFVRAKELGLNDMEKEHVTPHFYKSGKFQTAFLLMPAELEKRSYRFTVDTEDDLRVVRIVASELGENFSYRDVLAVADKYPELLEIMQDAVEKDKKVGR